MNMPSPASTASPKASSSVRRSRPRSKETRERPAPRYACKRNFRGAAVHHSRRCRRRRAQRGGCRPRSSRRPAPSRCRPLAVGTEPASTPGRAGSSSWSRSSRRAAGARTAATCAARPSASELVRSATAPGSASAGSMLRVSSSDAASVHGPQTWILKVRRSRLRPPPSRPGRRRCSSAARPESRPGLAPSRQPPAVVCTGRSTSRPAVRPIRSAPGPAGRKLGQVRQVRQLAEYDRDRLARVGARHRAHAGSTGRWPGKRLLSWSPGHRSGRH